ncbi:MAG: hypothetical protein M1820_004632 [Bogoriella megaspora]|nr:MAG: hypothetical protein M1820_004632 [Bogoriella megaspora]
MGLFGEEEENIFQYMESLHRVIQENNTRRTAQTSRKSQRTSPQLQQQPSAEAANTQQHIPARPGQQGQARSDNPYTRNDNAGSSSYHRGSNTEDTAVQRWLNTRDDYGVQMRMQNEERSSASNTASKGGLKDAPKRGRSV